MLRDHLPGFIKKRLFGNRDQFGTQAILDDSDFLSWQEAYTRFYANTQRRGIGNLVNHWGFKISQLVDLKDKEVLEVGPGFIEHLRYNSTRPKSYILADVRQDFLEESARRLKDFGVSNISTLAVQGTFLPLPKNSVDVVFSFHQLEHIYEIKSYLQELKRVLRPDGLLVGAIPCEGGIAWGLGRLLLSCPYAKKQLGINYDKIICWEHPNFIDDLKRLLDNEFSHQISLRRPLGNFPFDLNLSWSFIYVNRK